MAGTHHITIKVVARTVAEMHARVVEELEQLGLDSTVDYIIDAEPRTLDRLYDVQTLTYDVTAMVFLDA